MKPFAMWGQAAHWGWATLAVLLCVLVWASLLAAAIRRLRNKLSPESKPTLWTYVNELGGYFLVGALVIGGFFVELVRFLFGK
jgi:hypothetical protein